MLFPQIRALFILIPLAEFVLFIVLGRYLGIPGTLALIILTALLGANLARSQGLQTLARFQQKLAEGQMPGAEIITGIMILAAGLFLITPGFLTDAIGFSLLVPPVRGLLGGWLLARCATRVDETRMPTKHGNHFHESSAAGEDAPTSRDPQVIDVETTERPLPEKE
jgi:UPF0716 protein FxsA